MMIWTGQTFCGEEAGKAEQEQSPFVCRPHHPSGQPAELSLFQTFSNSNFHFSNFHFSKLSHENPTFTPDRGVSLTCCPSSPITTFTFWLSSPASFNFVRFLSSFNFVRFLPSFHFVRFLSDFNFVRFLLCQIGSWSISFPFSVSVSVSSNWHFFKQLIINWWLVRYTFRSQIIHI